ncbi:unnamed protein product [Ascophyllum nodosum]
MTRGVISIFCGTCSLLAAGVEGFVGPFNPRMAAKMWSGRGRRPVGGYLSMIVPKPGWGYVCEEINDYPEYIPNMGVEGESKPGSTPEAFPPEELPIDDFEHGGVYVYDFHELPSLERPCFVEMKTFIDQEGLAMLPSEAEMLERDIHVERKRRSEARKERFVEEPDEDLVDDTLEDVSLSADAAITAIPTDATPSVDFDENDAYDDGYDTGDAVGVAGVEDAMYQ